MKRSLFLTLIILLVSSTSITWAAVINDVRTNISPTRVRIVLDVDEAIKFKESYDGDSLVLDLDAKANKNNKIALNDSAVKEIVLKKEKRNKSKLSIVTNEKKQYKIFVLKEPNRIVIDIYRLDVYQRSYPEVKGLKYTVWQDDMAGNPVQIHILELAQNAEYEIRPISGAINKNGRGSLSKAAQAVGATAAINASYFDKSGWIIGNLKYGNIWLGMETLPRSAIVMKNKKAQVIKDLAYAGNISFPTLNNLTLAIKGVNRERIADDIVLYNRHFDDGTRTNCYGLEMRISNGIITEISRAGNMKLDDKSLVLSVHGVHLNSLASLKVGDRINLRQGFNQNIADDADLVIGGGPLLVENGRKNVRINQEKIPNDIARGRAPRTALGIKKDGTMIFLVVDGRRSDSVGMTLDELADYLIKIGAEQAINLDGGGSSVMVLNNKIVNKPSDGKERFISVGMGIFRA